MNFQAGEILYFDKPLHWTSFNLVAKIRSALCHKIGVRKLKVGHAGTLDPLATGIVTICTGKATKRIDELQAHTKEYVATLQLGATTPSFDLETNIDATFPTAHITEQMIQEVLEQFKGRIEQVPPAFSACKVDGHRAYALARKGKDVQLKAKQRNLYQGIGQRHRRSPTERRTPDSSAQNKGRRHQSGGLYEDGGFFKLAGTTRNRDKL